MQILRELTQGMTEVMAHQKQPTFAQSGLRKFDFTIGILPRAQELREAGLRTVSTRLEHYALSDSRASWAKDVGWKVADKLGDFVLSLVGIPLCMSLATDLEIQSRQVSGSACIHSSYCFVGHHCSKHLAALYLRLTPLWRYHMAAQDVEHHNCLVTVTTMHMSTLFCGAHCDQLPLCKHFPRHNKHSRHRFSGRADWLSCYNT